MLENLVPTAIGVLMGAVTTYIIAKRMTNTSKILENLMENEDLLTEFAEMFLEKVATNQKIQQGCYLIGGLIGKGAKDGLGLSGRGRKNDVMSLISMFLGGMGGKQQTETSVEAIKNVFK